MKHTPGPWEFFNGTITAHKDKKVIKRIDEFDWVATVQVSNRPEWEANARLIAAAPELLEALKSVCQEIKELTGFDAGSYYRGVIAKAEGNKITIGSDAANKFDGK